MIFVPITLALPLALPALQEGEAGRPAERIYTPDRVQVGPPPTRDEPGISEAQLFTPAQQPVEATSDEVPLPIPPVLEGGPDGDRLVAEASGDPYFLGFAAGPYFPPSDELVDPALLASYTRGIDGRPGDFTYAVVMFSKRMTNERLAQLEAAGCRLLGFHPHYTVKVAIPMEAIDSISTLPFVRWVGAPQTWQKLSPHSRELTDVADENELMPFHVSVWESDLCAASKSTPIGRVDVVDGNAQYSPETEEDQRARIWQSNGWMHAALLQRGIEVVSYSPSIQAFQVLINKAQMRELTQLDFVLFVEPVLEPTLASPFVAPGPLVAPHDESTAMVMTDRVRAFYDGGTNQAAIVGIIDSGVENSHADLNIWGVGWSCNGDDPWNDDVSNGGSGHGTHTTGTILGRGVAEADQLGNQPGLASWGGTSRYFNFRGFSPGSCLSGNIQVATNIFANSYFDGTNTTPRPMVISNSWGYTSFIDPIGTEANCRTLDDATYQNGQLYVFATGNEGPSSATLRIEGSAKNVLSVGNIVDFIDGTVGDPGNLWTSSSRGPCGDNRWKPNITAPGRWVRSAIANDPNGYSNYSGTSMATPHVTAAAASLCDHYSWARYQPALLSSMLMATAVTDNDAILTVPSDSHLDKYGAGRLNAYKAHYNTSDFGYIGNWKFDQTNANWFYGDFTVPTGTTRLVAVMRYVEEQSSAGASKALVNDYDLWLDRDPIDSAGNTGEYFAQQSSVDNTEIRIINNPASGAWRWKTYPESANSNVVKMAVTIYAIYDDTTPNATLTLSVDDAYVKVGEQVNATATVDPTSYVASAVVLDRSGSAATLQSSSTTLYDGTVTDLLDSGMAGQDITLGDTLFFDDRAGTWGLTYSSEGTKSITVNARSDNMVDKTATVNVTVDSTPPGRVTNLTSTSHTVNTWSNDPTITWTWNAATDNLSGIQGYGIFEYTNCGSPITLLDIGPVTTYTSGAYSSSTSGRYFNIRSVDMCDNWDSIYVCDGPYFIDVTPPTAPTFSSSDHVQGGKSCNPNISVTWNAASDAHSGVAGYSYYWSTSATSCPDSTLDTATTTASTTLPLGTWYLHVRTIDVAGNATDCGSVAHFGPFTILSTCQIFFDDFESGGFAAGGWNISSTQRCKVNDKSAFTGTYGARLKKGGVGTGACTVGTDETWMELTVDSTGWSAIQVNMDAHFRKNELACEFLDLQWFDGALWQSAGQVEAHAWGAYSFTLPAAAMGDPALRVRLITNAKGKAERAEIDNFELVGIE